MPTISLPPRCDRAAAEALLPEMIAALGSGPLAIDARACTQIGQVMLQVLVSARRTGEGAIIDASPTLRDTARRLGLEAELFDDAQTASMSGSEGGHKGASMSGSEGGHKGASVSDSESGHKGASVSDSESGHKGASVGGTGGTRA